MKTEREMGMERHAKAAGVFGENKSPEPDEIKLLTA